MERRLPLLLALIALNVFGCSREKAAPTAAAPAPAEAAAQPREVSSSETSQGATSIGAAGMAYLGGGYGGGASASRVSERSSGSDFFPGGGSPGAMVDVPGPKPDAAEIQAFVRRQGELAEQRARSEEIRRKALEELQKNTVLGALGSGNSQNSDSSLFGTTEAQDPNPLRTDAPPRLAPRAAAPEKAGNPLRQAREPRIPATPPPSFASPFAPAVPQFEPSGGSSRLVVDNAARGGSASSPFDPAGGSAPIEPREAKAGAAERAFAGGVPIPKGPPPSAPIAFKPELSAPVVEDPSEFDTVEVLYGTDRLAGEHKASDVWHLLLQFLPTLAVAILGVCVILVALKQRNWLLGTTAVTGLAVCVLLGYDAVDEVLERIRGANHQGPRYTTDRSPSGKIEVGRCQVAIPRTHKVGEVEAPSIFRLEITPDYSRHLVLQKTERLANPKFEELLRSRVEKSARRELFVFVHGFNVSFEDAALRTAQISYDLKFEGAPIFFSWPANDKFIFTYPADETNVAWSVPHLKQFLLTIVRESKAQSVNLIAHSMGNRALAAALREIDLEMHDQARLFNQVILAAPDIDADDFRNNIAPAMQRTARGLTLYASSHDEALLASQFIHRRPRAGDAGDGLTVITGIDTIDVTAIDQSFFGHTYYGSSHPVLNDLKALLMGAVPPRDRTWLSPAERDGLTYWIFQPARTAAAEGRRLSR